MLAEDTRLGRHVALKTVSGPQAGTPDGRQQLLAEARAAAALSHPAIAAVHDVIEVDGEVAIVFELAEGETLAARLAKGPLRRGAGGRHRRPARRRARPSPTPSGVLHRDLKPSNVMLGPGGAVKILDFGIARLRARSENGDAAAPRPSFSARPGYVAPEQWVGRPADERADLYALGVVLFEMVSGKRPFPEREPFSLARASLDRIARRLSGRLSPRCRPASTGWSRGCSLSDPDLRPPSARVVADELRQLQAPPAPPPRAAPWLAWAGECGDGSGSGLGCLGVAPGVVATDRPPVIAVLPLENATGDDANDYLVGRRRRQPGHQPGVAADGDGAVAGRGRRRARARSAIPPTIARDLDASFVVEGSVQRAGAQVRLALNLLRQDGSVAWADAVEGPAEGVFGMQARLAGALGSALSVQMSATDRARLNTPPTSNTDALDAYWRGRALLERRDAPGNLQRAVVAFNEALRLDARFVDAHAALAEADWELYNTTRESQYVEAALQASKNAVALAPDDAGVRVALGVTLTRGGRNAEAVRGAAAGARPSSPTTTRRGDIWAAHSRPLGRVDEAVAEWRKALALRPNNWQVLSDMGLALYQATRYDDCRGRLPPARSSCARQRHRLPDARRGPPGARAERRRPGYYGKPSPSRRGAAGPLQHGRAVPRAWRFRARRRRFRRAIDQRPNPRRPTATSATRCCGWAAPAEARAAYRRAAELAEAARVVNPADDAEPGVAGGLPAEGRRRCGGRRWLDEALRRAPSDPQVHYRAALVHALAGRHRRRPGCPQARPGTGLQPGRRGQGRRVPGPAQGCAVHGAGARLSGDIVAVRRPAGVSLRIRYPHRYRELRPWVLESG